MAIADIHVNEEEVDSPHFADEDEEYEEEEETDDNEDEGLVKKKEEDRRQTRTAALYLYLAFLLCSAAFEPDFGSWIRHQGVALPIILLIL